MRQFQPLKTEPRPRVAALLRLALVALWLLPSTLLSPAAHAAPSVRSLAALQGTTPTPTATLPADLATLAQMLDAAWNAQNWPEAIRLIEAIIAINPSYDNIQERYYYAYVNYGFQLLTQAKCAEATAAFRRALELRPGGQEAERGLQLVATYCITPVPTATATPPVTATVITATPPPGATATPPVTITCTPVPGPTCITTPITYTVQPKDTLFSLARRYCTTIQAIMQANGMMTYVLRAYQVIWIPPGGVPASGPLVHIVQPGETLFSLARQYHTTVWAIMTANGLRNTTIRAYRALFIPTSSQTAPIVHIVQPGETLYTIAQRYGTTVALIMLANGLRTYTLYVYQRLVIPPAGWTGGPLGVPPCPGGPCGGPPPGQRLYIVQRGDTLFSIAQRFGTTVQALMAANGLSNSDIKAGQTLQIP